ncbi:MAG: DUF4349 domain-containing protein [Chloroflexi bacterium]|nr:DUF4349 domain-containing protein [Chloroflexota bacterium]
MKSHHRTVIAFVAAGAVASLTLLGSACGASDNSTGSSVPPGPSAATVSPRTASGTGGDATTSTESFAASPAEKSTGGVSAQPPSGSSAPATSGAAPGAGNDGNAANLASTLDRKIIFNAAINLGVKDVPQAFNAASAIARDNGGFVEKSTFRGGSAGSDGRDESATLTIRVPADKYQDALQAIRTIDGAKVQQEGSKSSEVTEQYTDLQSRQRNLERTESQYLKLLEQAKSINDILTVNDRLDNVRAQIEQIQGRLNVLDRLADLATIDVTLAPIAIGKPGTNDGSTSVRAAFSEAWAGSLDVVRSIARGGAVVAVAAAWLALPVLALYLLGRRFVSRTRNRTASPS